jgi:hypothetical protein
VSYQIVWNEAAVNTAAGYLRDDPTGLADLIDSIDHLADDPRPDRQPRWGRRTFNDCTPSADLRHSALGGGRAMG